MKTINLATAKARLDIFLASYNRALGDYSLTGETALLFHGVVESCVTIDVQVPGFAWEIMEDRYSGRVVYALGGDTYIEFEVGPYEDTTRVRIRNETRLSEVTPNGRLETIASIRSNLAQHQKVAKAAVNSIPRLTSVKVA